MTQLTPESFRVPSIRDFALRGDAPPLTQPSSLQASAGGTDITLSWQDNAPNADGYNVLRSTALLAVTDEYVQIAQVLKPEGQAKLEEHIDMTGQSETLFCYRVEAFKGSQVSVVSNTACATTE